MANTYKVVCKDCEEEVSTSLLKQHQLYFCAAATEKLQQASLKCPLCEEVFDKKDALQKHRAEHQETSMILEYAERAGFVPANLLDLLRNTLLTNHDFDASAEGVIKVGGTMNAVQLSELTTSECLEE